MKKIIILVFVNIFIFVSVDLSVGTWYLASTHRQRYTRVEQDAYMNRNRMYNNYYDHGFLPNTSVTYQWGNLNYMLYTNSLGFVDSSERFITQRTTKYRILFMGDSFTEGVGYPYGDTFVGLLDKKINQNTIELLNAGAQSYSPKIYYNKLKYLIENIGLSLDEVVVLIDISDIQNEVTIYNKFPPRFDQPFSVTPFTSVIDAGTKIVDFLYDHSLTVNTVTNFVSKLVSKTTPGEKDPLDVQAPMWTYDKTAYEQFGKDGLGLCKLYMTQLVQLLQSHNIRNISIVVYPWPEQIAHDTRKSIQVTFWEDFSRQYGVHFINLFPAFFDASSNQNLYIPGDVHFNANGHRLVASKLFDALGMATRSGTTRTSDH